MNMIKRELKSNFKSMIIWSLSVSLLVLVWMIEYESFAGNPAINDLMDSLPQELLALMGFGDFSLSTLGGFVGTISLYLYLLLGIHAALLGSSIISKEERDRTAEFLFSLPISRIKIMLGKISAAVIVSAIINLFVFLSMVLSTLKYEKDENFYGFIAFMFLGVFIVQLIFLSMGMLLASLNRNYKKSGNMAVTMVMITFLISSLIDMVKGLDFLKYLTPFKYFNATDILEKLSLDPIFIVISIMIIVTGVAGSIIIYPKRDLNI
ncbi:MAG: ABC transporter permease subunit [Clostridium sp.]|jgi:ABC-2 type transport system permease protein|nr:ABC transporter permease subunit [Clostridium sp.]